MIRYLPFAIELALLVFCVIDVVQSPEIDIRNLPKWGWIVLICSCLSLGASRGSLPVDQYNRRRTRGVQVVAFPSTSAHRRQPLTSIRG